MWRPLQWDVVRYLHWCVVNESRRGGGVFCCLFASFRRGLRKKIPFTDNKCRVNGQFVEKITEVDKMEVQYSTERGMVHWRSKR